MDRGKKKVRLKYVQNCMRNRKKEKHVKIEGSNNITKRE